MSLTDSSGIWHFHHKQPEDKSVRLAENFTRSPEDWEGTGRMNLRGQDGFSAGTAQCCYLMEKHQILAHSSLLPLDLAGKTSGVTEVI